MSKPLLTTAEKILIAEAAEEMRPQIEGPARPQDYTLTADDIGMLQSALMAWELILQQEGQCLSELRCSKLRDKLSRGFETVIRDIQPI